MQDQDNELNQEPKPARKRKLVPVAVLDARKEAALVEWQDKGVHRAYIPVGAIEDGKVDSETLSAGIPYGVPWEKIPLAQPQPAMFAEALRQAGIWTQQDLYRRPNVAIAALQSVYQVDLGALITFAGHQEE